MKVDLPYLEQSDIDKAFDEHVEETKECGFDLENFKPGTYGFFELIDRSMICYENFETYCLEHPATAVDKEIFDMASKTVELIFQFYQMVACKDWDENEEKLEQKTQDQ